MSLQMWFYLDRLGPSDQYRRGLNDVVCGIQAKRVNEIASNGTQFITVCEFEFVQRLSAAVLHWICVFNLAI